MDCSGSRVMRDLFLCFFGGGKLRLHLPLLSVEIGPVFSKEMSSSWITCHLGFVLGKSEETFHWLSEYFKVSKKTSAF